MQFIDLQSQQEIIKKGINSAISKVLDHGKYIFGPEVFELENQLKIRAQRKYCVSCASGTDALYMALKALGVKEGDAIFTTPFTFIATVEAIAMCGATPVFVDVDKDSMNISVEKLKNAISSFSQKSIVPKAVMTVNIFGLTCEYDEILKLCKANELFLIEDAAQSFGATYKNQPSCSFGDVSCTSFFPAKPLGCYGDGGAIFTDDEETHEKLISIRVHGQSKTPYVHDRLGITGRLDSIQAAILLEKLKIFDEEIDKRNIWANMYNEKLCEIKNLKVPSIFPAMKSAWAQYTLQAKDESTRGMMIDALKDQGIPTAIYYPISMHLQKVFKDLGYKHGDMPASENLSECVFSLPMHPYLNESVIAKIAEVLKSV